jgi:DNA integrity scanning protein DisA with diadenylate cyclase activity
MFFVQSNSARKHLEREADQFREDVRAKERQIQAEDVVSRVSDAARRDELRARIVHRILGLQQDQSTEVNQVTPGGDLSGQGRGRPAQQ